MNELQATNYVTIQGWMVTELGLKGNDLLVYAIIYGFSQLPGQCFEGSRQYLADWTGCSKRGIAKNLQNLVDKSLIVKEDYYVNNIKFCRYKALACTVPGNSVHGGGELSSPNNININNIYPLSNNIPSLHSGILYRETPTGVTPPKKEDSNNLSKEERKPIKHKYGQYDNVLLTDEELDKLRIEFPTDYQTRIERLSEYIASTGKSYKNHLATIRVWARKDGERPNLRQTKQSDGDETFDFFLKEAGLQ